MYITGVHVIHVLEYMCITDVRVLHVLEYMYIIGVHVLHVLEYMHTHVHVFPCTQIHVYTIDYMCTWKT